MAHTNVFAIQMELPSRTFAIVTVGRTFALLLEAGGGIRTKFMTVLG